MNLIQAAHKSELGMWCIYDHPRDYPESFVARLFELDQPTPFVMRARDLETLRERFRAEGLVCISRSESDPANYVEAWL